MCWINKSTVSWGKASQKRHWNCNGDWREGVFFSAVSSRVEPISEASADFFFELIAARDINIAAAEDFPAGKRMTQVKILFGP